MNKMVTVIVFSGLGLRAGVSKGVTPLFPWEVSLNYETAKDGCFQLTGKGINLVNRTGKML